jgi:hypothetical protein
MCQEPGKEDEEARIIAPLVPKKQFKSKRRKHLKILQNVPT